MERDGAYTFAVGRVRSGELAISKVDVGSGLSAIR
jgi:hypothetical protein